MNSKRVEKSSIRPSTAVVVTVEHFGTNLVGAYGNAICPTPHLDRFAARSFVSDQFWMDGCTTASLLESMWSGKHRLHRRQYAANETQTPHPSCIQSPGLLVTDSPTAFEIGKNVLGGEAILASPPAEDQTAFSSLVAQSLEQWIPRMDSLPWLWIHSRGLVGPWDAPYEYRCSMCGEGDPLPPKETTPPTAQLEPDYDPDILFGWACGAGAQAMVIDEVWEWLESALQDLEVFPTCLLAFAGVMGFPLGEHLRVGYATGSEQVGAPKFNWPDIDSAISPWMNSELLHAPLIVRPGDSLPLGVRFAPFLQPNHLGRLLDAWIERDGWQSLEQSPESLKPEHLNIEQLVAISSLRPDAWPAMLRAALAIHGPKIALLVPGWGAIWEALGEDESQSGALFAMPDDRWQQNEIRSRAPEVLERMQRLRDEWLANSEDSPSNIELILSRMDESLWRPHR